MSDYGIHNLPPHQRLNFNIVRAGNSQQRGKAFDKLIRYLDKLIKYSLDKDLKETKIAAIRADETLQEAAPASALQLSNILYRIKTNPDPVADAIRANNKERRKQIAAVASKLYQGDCSESSNLQNNDYLSNFNHIDSAISSLTKIFMANLQLESINYIDEQKMENNELQKDPAFKKLYVKLLEGLERNDADIAAPYVLDLSIMHLDAQDYSPESRSQIRAVQRIRLAETLKLTKLKDASNISDIAKLLLGHVKLSRRAKDIQQEDELLDSLSLLALMDLSSISRKRNVVDILNRVKLEHPLSPVQEKIQRSLLQVLDSLDLSLLHTHQDRLSFTQLPPNQTMKLTNKVANLLDATEADNYVTTKALQVLDALEPRPYRIRDILFELDNPSAREGYKRAVVDFLTSPAVMSNDRKFKFYEEIINRVHEDYSTNNHYQEDIDYLYGIYKGKTTQRITNNDDLITAYKEFQTAALKSQRTGDSYAAAAINLLRKDPGGKRVIELASTSLRHLPEKEQALKDPLLDLVLFIASSPRTLESTLTVLDQTPVSTKATKGFLREDMFRELRSKKLFIKDLDAITRNEVIRTLADLAENDAIRNKSIHNNRALDVLEKLENSNRYISQTLLGASATDNFHRSIFAASKLLNMTPHLIEDDRVLVK